MSTPSSGRVRPGETLVTHHGDGRYDTTIGLETAVAGVAAAHGPSCACGGCARFVCGICGRDFDLATFNLHMRPCVLSHANEPKIAALVASEIARGREDLARRMDPAGRWRKGG